MTTGESPSGTSVELFPRVMYLQPKESPNISAVVISGETARSWIGGSSWRPTKYAKNKYTVKTADEYNDREWYLKNYWKIANDLRTCRDVAVFKKIAEMIGYKEQI